MHVLIFLLMLICMLLLELLFRLSSKLLLALLLALPQTAGASSLRENQGISCPPLLTRRVLYHKSAFDSTTTRRPALLLVYSHRPF